MYAYLGRGSSKVSVASEAAFCYLLSALMQLQVLCWPQEGN